MCFAISVISSDFVLSCELKLALSARSCYHMSSRFRPQCCIDPSRKRRALDDTLRAHARYGARLFLTAGEFFLGRGGSAGQDAEDFIFFHDDELFAIDLDFGAGVLAEQDAVAFFDGQREGLAFVVGAAFAGGEDRKSV